jgi:hypothetical protein
MVKETLGSYYEALKRALNPAFYETEWTSFQLMPERPEAPFERVRACRFRLRN